MRTFVSVLKISSLSSVFGKPMNSTLSSRPGLSTAGSMISTKTENNSKLSLLAYHTFLFATVLNEILVEILVDQENN